MIIGILQPGYLPWLGFFEQVYKSDVFVIYDDVQYDKHGWRNRNRIKTPQGPLWLTIPVNVTLRDRPRNMDIRIDNKTKWKAKHLQTLKHNYSRAPYSAHYLPIFEEAFGREWEYLIDIDIFFVEQITKLLGMTDKKFVRSSTLGIEGGRIERLIRICQRFEADTFYEGASGRDYIDEAEFVRHGIEVRYQEYRHPVYKQLHGDFVPYLSIIDLLLNHGPDSLSILTTSAKESSIT